MKTTKVKRKVTRKKKESSSGGILRRLAPQQRRLLAQALDSSADFVANPLFRRRNAEKVVMEKAFQVDPSDYPLTYIHDLDRADASRSPQTSSPLTAEKEQQVFRQYNYWKFRLAKLQRQAKDGLVKSLADEIIECQRRITASRTGIVRANMALVLAMAKRSRISGVDFGELISEGNLALLRAVDKFDFARGFKFSTYACRAILKAFSRAAMKSSRYRTHFPTEFDPAMEATNYPAERRAEQQEEAAEELRSILGRNLAELSDVEKTVIQHRFPVGSHDRPKTLEQVGRIIGVTKERVRQIQNKALNKIREVIEEKEAAPPDNFQN